MVSMYIFFLSLGATVGFLVLASAERSRGRRVYAPLREKIDSYVERSIGFCRSVPFGELLSRLVRSIGLEVSHFVVAVLHFLAKRVEKLLRRLRRKIQQETRPQEEPSAYVQAMKEAKNGAARKEEL